MLNNSEKIGLRFIDSEGIFEIIVKRCRRLQITNDGLQNESEGCNYCSTFLFNLK